MNEFSTRTATSGVVVVSPFLNSDSATVTLCDDGHPAAVDLSAVTLLDELAEQGRR
ncbi:hypothetical protein [Mycobacterium sp. ACS1612]|uniref:hypothetical protein n=1 Tax=Mycobacterium sp. ACS1612 TaxID=1834117 RepID=UPI000A6FD51E|nr:hypothetical protein [Mycobacterium sp. ACS1612]